MDAKRDPDALAIADCRDCRVKHDRLTRQSWACGYEPPAPDGIAVTPWEHRGRPAPKDEPKICAGYVCNLPEVIEIARAHLHWSKGSLLTFCRGEHPTDPVFDGIERFEGALNSLNAWLMRPKDQT